MQASGRSRLDERKIPRLPTFGREAFTFVPVSRPWRDTVFFGGASAAVRLLTFFEVQAPAVARSPEAKGQLTAEQSQRARACLARDRRPVRVTRTLIGSDITTGL